jgi:4-alpha-glucanotransferase
MPDAVVYTGTHDNDTTRGWFASAGKHERGFALRYLRCEPDQVVREMVRQAFASVAFLALAPMQDILEVGTEGRMNFPSRADGNWEWRFTADALTDERATWLRDLATLYGRYAPAEA